MFRDSFKLVPNVHDPWLGKEIVPSKRPSYSNVDTLIVPVMVAWPVALLKRPFPLVMIRIWV